MPTHIPIANAHGKGGRCALRPEQEQEVFRRVSAREITQYQIAEEMGVHRNTISNIMARLSTQTPGPHEAQGQQTSSQDAS